MLETIENALRADQGKMINDRLEPPRGDGILDDPSLSLAPRSEGRRPTGLNERRLVKLLSHWGSGAAK